MNSGAGQSRQRQRSMGLGTEFAVSRTMEGFAPMHERLVCEERLRPEAPGTEPCFRAELGEMFGASSWP